jgi:hypothetical protein
MQKRYGRKYVERVFEKQLALIMQSFGLYVVSTRVGQSTVDLVCISSDPLERITLLVEAKTTKGNYSLPRKDDRALRDYIDDVRRILTTLPPLSLVLLLGNKPSRTLNAKLGRLETHACVPVRFMPARELALLRERIIGPLPLRIFIREAVARSRIVDATAVTAIVESYDATQAAHRSFVEAMLSTQGTLPAIRKPRLDSEKPAAPRGRRFSRSPQRRNRSRSI